ncbi:TonB-dependent receptor [Halioxenophilus sp. WMMB6]|uniref:TonB-dependent receptor n=1 Tax=Halioxenophilus sp. WMMB6 TaxID=3073815 RepID=UPI00295E552E|nr:TonB-dependent receptor [Halioxenophilus sp. WMMB6]
MNHSKVGKYLYLTGAAFALNPIYAAIAQDSESSEPVFIEEMVVTARKREESIVDVPLSIQAFSKRDLDAAGLSELESVAQFTPNMDFQNVGNSQPGRFNSAIRFRGMDMSITTPTNQTGGFYVDGVNILGGAGSVSFTDIGQVEVIRGPQPVYFGRGTFGGAINYTTVTPTEEFGGQISVDYSPTFGSTDINGYVEGKLVDNVNGRLTMFSRKQGAPFDANDGGALGEEKTDGISVILSFTPTDKLDIKTRLAYSQDDDGAPASTFVPFSTYNNIAVGDAITVPTSNGTVTTAFRQPWLSGDVPYIDISSNTSFYDILVNGQAMYGSPLADGTYSVAELLAGRDAEGDTPSLSHVGLRSDLLVFSTALNYDLSDSLTLSALVGYSKRDTTQIRDADQTDSQAWMLHTYLELESTNVEARINWDNGGAIRLMGGLNYSELDQMGDVDGGWNAFNGYFGGFLYGYGASVLDATNIETLGVFGSFEWDLTDWATFVAEARYQDDTTKNSSGYTEATLTGETELSFEAILPRVSINFEPLPDSNLYLSYSEGQLPGAYNAMFDSMDPTDAAEFLAANPDVAKETDEETLKLMELGWKQSLMNGQLWYSLVAFSQEWDGMKSSGLYTFTASSGTPYFLTPTIAGSSTQQGIEAEVRWSATENLTVQGAYGYVESEYDQYNSNSFRSLLGLSYGTFYKADGNTLPRSPKHSGAIGVTWTDDLMDGWDYSLRADVVYRSETYADELNLTTIKAYSLVNLRAGISSMSGVDLELYCDNCFDKEGWATGRRLTDFGAMPNFFATQGVVVDPITPREVGIKAVYNF